MKVTQKMVLTTLIGILAFGSIGYSATKSKISIKKATTNVTRKFSCDSRNVTVENISKDRVKLTESNGKVYNLKLTKSASGESYTGNGVSIHMKGNDAIFTKDGNDESCYLTGSNNSNGNGQSSNGNMLRKFECEGYQDVTVENLSDDRVKLADGYGAIYTLNSAVSASGEKYSNGNISIHMKGQNAIYTENGKDKSCSLKSTERGSIKE